MTVRRNTQTLRRTALNDTDMTGSWILGQFRVIRRLASGGMSEVYLAEQPSMGRRCALKIVAPSATWSAESGHRLRQEARTASRLSHPNIVTQYSFAEQADGTLVLAMEYIDGPDLRGLLRQGPLSVESIVEIASQCCHALAFAHSQNVVHRDLKPGNIMVTHMMGHPLVKLVDFGFAQLIADVGGASESFVGTPRYVSPEQCRGESATPLSDQYVMGLVLYEMITGKPAIEATDLFACLHEHQHRAMPQPSLRRSVPEMRTLDSIVGKMAEKDPGSRYANMMEVLEAIGRAREALSSQGVSLPTKAPGGPDGAKATVHAGCSTRSESSLLRQLAALPLFGTETLLRPDDRKKVEEMGRLRLRRGTGRDSDALIGPTTPTLGVLSLAGSTWLRGWNDWLETIRADGSCARPSRLLVCVDGHPQASDLLDSLNQFQHVLIGAHPLEPLPLSVALGWMQRTDGVGIEHFISDKAVQVRQVGGTAQRKLCVDAMLQDVQAAGVRQRARNALAEVAEELILNAIYHAPGDVRSPAADSGGERAAKVVLNSGEEVTVRWVVCKDVVVLSVRDRFGSLTADLVSKHLADAPRRFLSRQRHTGKTRGLGFHITARAARDLIIAVSPGNWCEIVAVVDRVPASSVKKSVCLLTGLESDLQWLGERLRARGRWDGSLSRIELWGEIDETCDFGPICNRTGPLRLDLGGITRVNSIGISAWLESWGGRASDLEVTLERCSSPMVRQFSNVPAMVIGRIVSLFAPYYCEHCDEERPILLQVEQLRGSASIPPPHKCAVCDNVLEFDELAAEYLSFLL